MLKIISPYAVEVSIPQSLIDLEHTEVKCAPPQAGFVSIINSTLEPKTGGMQW